MNKCAVILAAGEGKRMKSNMPKPMSEVLSKPMLRWVIDAVKDAGIDNICIVTGYKKECIEEYIKRKYKRRNRLSKRTPGYRSRCYDGKRLFRRAKRRCSYPLRRRSVYG